MRCVSITPLGLARGARGVDHGGQVLGRRGRGQGDCAAFSQPLGQRLHGDLAQGLQCGGIAFGFRLCGPGSRLGRCHDHLAQRRQGLARGADLVPSGLLCHEQHGHLGVGQDVGNAARVVYGVQRHGHMAAAQAGQVDGHGVQTVGQQDGDARSCRQLLRGQRLRPEGHTLAGLCPVQRLPAARILVIGPVGLACGRLLHAQGQHFHQGGGRGHAGIGWQAHGQGRGAGWVLDAHARRVQAEVDVAADDSRGFPQALASASDMSGCGARVYAALQRFRVSTLKPTRSRMSAYFATVAYRARFQTGRPPARHGRARWCRLCKSAERQASDAAARPFWKC